LQQICRFWAVNCTKCVRRPGSAPTRWGSYSAPPDSLAATRGGQGGKKRFGSGEGEEGEERKKHNGVGMRGKWKEGIGRGRESKGEGGSGRGREARESGWRARLGYLSGAAEFLVTPLIILVHALGRHTQRYSQWGSSSNADFRYQYCSHRFHRLTALIIHHALTLSFHA